MSNTEQDPSTKSPVKPGDLPPLGPTAQVPPIHSDKLNDPNYWNDKLEGKTARVPRKERDHRHVYDDDESHTGLGWKKPAAVGALVLATAAGAFGIGKATGGNDTNTEPRVEPSVSAPAEVLTQAQIERSKLRPAVANEAMLPTSYYEEGGETDLSGIDMDLLENNLNTLLDNIVYMQEIGDFSVMDKTFLEDSDGNYPGAAAEVEGVKANYQLNEAAQATNQNQPISSMQVESIQSVIPAGFETVEVTATVSSLTWGNPTGDKVGNAFSSVHTTRYTLQAQETPIEGSEATENIWLILHEEAVN